MATSDGSLAASPTVIVSRSVTPEPSMARTDTVPSPRLAISGRSPAQLIVTPEGCLPTVCATTCPRLPRRSTTCSTSSGSGFLGSSVYWCTELATRAHRSSGVMATFVGGPTTLLATPRMFRTRGGNWPKSRIVRLSTIGAARPFRHRSRGRTSLHWPRRVAPACPTPQTNSTNVGPIESNNRRASGSICMAAFTMS